ncbi:chromosome partitioning protein ParB [Yersinia kristensenii]|nr:chromosome partitioning protein ParB [Yersinia kristensenii]
MKRAPVMKNAPKIEINNETTVPATGSVARQPAAPAVSQLTSRVNAMTGNHITLSVCGRDVHFVLKTIPAERVKKATMVWGGNERDQELLTESALDDLIPSFKLSGQQNPAYGREVNGVIEVADGSRRRKTAIITKTDYRVLVGDLDEEQMSWLSQIGNDYRPTSAFERGQRYSRRLNNEFDGNVSKLAEAENISRKIIMRCIKTAELPREIIGLFTSPNELSARAGETLAKLFIDNEDAMYSFAQHLSKRKSYGEDFSTEEIIDQLTAVAKKPKAATKVRSFGAGISAKYRGDVVSISMKKVPEDLLKKIESLLEDHLKEQEERTRNTVNDTFSEMESVVNYIKSAAKAEEYDLPEGELLTMIPIARNIISTAKDEKEYISKIRYELNSRFII